MSEKRKRTQDVIDAEIKRQRMADMENNSRRLRIISSKQDLTKNELRECAKIVKAGTPSDGHIISLVRQDIFDLIFANWTTARGAPAIPPVRHFPIDKYSSIYKELPVGVLHFGMFAISRTVNLESRANVSRRLRRPRGDGYIHDYQCNGLAT